MHKVWPILITALIAFAVIIITMRSSMLSGLAFGKGQ